MNRVLPLPRSQRGAALATSLILLLMLTLIGVTAMQSTTLEEKMAGNLRSEHLAFQAAEAALRAGEEWLQTTCKNHVFHLFYEDSSPTSLVLNPDGLYRPTLSLTQQRWQQKDIWTSGSARYRDALDGVTLDGVAKQPRYIIEQLTQPPQACLRDKNQVCYRITARGWGSTPDAVVTLQSYFHLQC